MAESQLFPSLRSPIQASGSFLPRDVPGAMVPTPGGLTEGLPPLVLSEGMTMPGPRASVSLFPCSLSFAHRPGAPGLRGVFPAGSWHRLWLVLTKQPHERECRFLGSSLVRLPERQHSPPPAPLSLRVIKLHP